MTETDSGITETDSGITESYNEMGKELELILTTMI